MDGGAGGAGEGVHVGGDPVGAEVVEDVDDFGPQDELGEALHEEHHGQVEGEVEDGPGLLPPAGEVLRLHPVEVDEEDEVGCRGAGGDDADDEGV